jgi:hypothetical protein
MAWHKLGRVFTPEGSLPWMRSYAANPVAEAQGGDVARVYFSSRDEKNRAHIGWVDVDLSDRPRVVGVAEKPVVAPGPLGGFDDSGASMGCLMAHGDRTLLFYLGWNLGVTVLWRNSIGLAIRERRDGPFEKYSPAPLLDRCAVDPFTVSYPFVLRDGPVWRMWYGSNLRWGAQERDMDHVIKYAESRDGLHWARDGRIALDLQGPQEYALCRPWVEKGDDGYRMWYCHRGDAYRIGCAESRDGQKWQRRPADIDVSADGWDAEMIAYPSLFVHNGRRFLFYNGNHYGKTGFGMAVEVS